MVGIVTEFLTTKQARKNKSITVLAPYGVATDKSRLWPVVRFTDRRKFLIPEVQFHADDSSLNIGTDGIRMQVNCFLCLPTHI